MDIQYKIIGGDDDEYGPASLEEIKSWIRDGRVAAMTKVWRSDLSAWSPADRYTELHEDLARLQAAASATANRALPAAGFWVRLGARFIDYLLVVILFLAVWGSLPLAQRWPMPEPPKSLGEADLKRYMDESNKWTEKALPVFYPIFLLYDVLLTGRFGATLGKMAIGAKITMVDGSPISYNRALLRWLGARLSELFFFAGYFLIFLRRDKRALHDLLVGTKVVFKR